MGGAAQRAVVLRTPVPGDQGIHAAAETDEQSRKQSHRRGGGADGGKGNGTGKFADDGDIRHVEQDLQQVGHHQRQTEPDNPGSQLFLLFGVW